MCKRERIEAVYKAEEGVRVVKDLVVFFAGGRRQV